MSTANEQIARAEVKSRWQSEYKIGENNPNWGGNNVSPVALRARTRRMLKRMGINTKGIAIKYIDGNPFNNDIKNLIIIKRKGGRGLTEEEIRKLSESKKRLYKEHPEARRIMAEAQKKRFKEHPISIEQRLKQSEIMKWYYKEHPEKILAGKDNPMYGKISPRRGKHLSEETRRKISEANKGNPSYMKGKHHSEETKKKLSEATKRFFKEHPEKHPTRGKHLSEETKRKIIMSQNRERMIKTKIGEKNPMWKGDKASPDSARERPRRMFKREGINIKGLDVHYADGNPYNQDRNNLLILSRKTHMMIDGRLEKLHATPQARPRKDETEVKRNG